MASRRYLVSIMSSSLEGSTALGGRGWGFLRGLPFFLGVLITSSSDPLCMIFLGISRQNNMHPSNKITISSLIQPLFFLGLSHPFALTHLHQSGHIKPIHIVHMGVYPTCLPEVRVVPLLNKFSKPLLPHLYLNILHLHKPLLQGKVNHLLILLGRY